MSDNLEHPMPHEWPQTARTWDFGHRWRNDFLFRDPRRFESFDPRPNPPDLRFNLRSFRDRAEWLGSEVHSYHPYTKGQRVPGTD